MGANNIRLLMIPRPAACLMHRNCLSHKPHDDWNTYFQPYQFRYANYRPGVRDKLRSNTVVKKGSGEVY